MYPLKFQPIFQKRLWGGQRLRGLLNKPVEATLREPVGESWELADLPAGTVKGDSAGAAADGSLSSVIANGAWAGKSLREAIGKSGAGIQKGAGGYFPLLIKFLDAQQDLSVQVHPDAEYCRRHPGSHLKTEAWYIMHAEAGARIYKGLKAGVTKEQFRAALAAGQVEPLLHAIPARVGDCHLLHSGTVHAIGAGILAAEVQTPSDTTFRVFDWNRLDSTGKARALHVEEALECIKFGSVPVAEALVSERPGMTRVAACDYFTIDRAQLGQGKTQAILDGMAIWIILQGQGVIAIESTPPTAFTKGDTILLPAGMKDARVNTIADTSWLEVRLP